MANYVSNRGMKKKRRAFKGLPLVGGVDLERVSRSVGDKSWFGEKQKIYKCDHDTLVIRGHIYEEEYNFWEVTSEILLNGKTLYDYKGKNVYVRREFNTLEEAINWLSVRFLGRTLTEVK